MVKEKNPKFIPILVVLIIIYAFIIFIYQMRFSNKTTILFTMMYAIFTILVFLFLKGMVIKNFHYLYTTVIVSLCLLFIVVIGSAVYFNSQKHADFHQKQLLLTGASSAYKTLNLDGENILSVEVGEYTKGDGFPYRYKVKITIKESEQPYYFECSDYMCSSMIRYNDLIEE